MSVGSRQYRYSYTPPPLQEEPGQDGDDDDSALVINVRLVPRPSVVSSPPSLQVSHTVSRLLVLQTVRTCPGWPRTSHLLHLGKFNSSYYFDEA